MSYCRWGSDAYCSDLYIYYSVGDFYSINVAGNRVVESELKNKPVLHASDSDSYISYINQCKRFIDSAEKEYIDLPYAGETIELKTAEECVSKVEELIELGYRVPDYVVESILSDADMDLNHD